MTHLLIRHRVKDYDAWKAEFDGFIAQRKAGGETGFQVYRPVDEPDNLVLLFEWDSVENASTFMHSKALKDAMNKAGVLEPPKCEFLHIMDRGATMEVAEVRT